MTEQEWLYIQDKYCIREDQAEWQQIKNFELREMQWRKAHIGSGMKLSRKEWEEDQEARYQAYLDQVKTKQKKRRNRNWTIFWLLLFFGYWLWLINLE